MKKKLIFILSFFLLIIIVGFNVEKPIVLKTNFTFEDLLKRQMNTQLIHQINKPFTEFKVDLALKTNNKIYTIYSSDYEYKISRIFNSEKIEHINYINLVALRQLDNNSIKVINQGEGLEITDISTSIMPIGMYDKDDNSYIVAGKVINYESRKFTKVKLKLKEGTLLESDLFNGGYFIFKFKATKENQIDNPKSMFNYGEEIEFIKAIDNKGNADTCNWTV